MADKKIQMKIKNGAAWDNLFPKTKIEVVEGAGSAASMNVGTAEGQIPVLASGGKLDMGLLPAIAINDTFVVADQTAMLALTAEVGDIAVRSDINKSYILKASGASTLANWQELLTPTSPVQSVAGKTGTVTIVKGDVGLGSVDNFGTATQAEAEAGASTSKFMTPQRTAQAIAALGPATSPVQSVAGRSGAVTLAKTDVGLGNVDNTSDVNKPVSTAQQTAINAKAPLASPTFTGTVIVPTPSTTDNSTKAASTAYVKSQGYSKISLASTAPVDANVDIWYEELV